MLLQAAGYRVHDHNGQCSVRLKTGDVWILNPPRRDLKSVLGCDCDEFVDFVSMLLQWDSALRPTALQALQHPFLLLAEECGDYEGVVCLVCCDSVGIALFFGSGEGLIGLVLQIQDW